MDLVAHRAASGRPAPVAAELLDRLDGAVERHPRHHLRVGEVAPRPAYLPDPLVRLAPAPLEVREQHALQRPGLVVGRDVAPPGLVEGVHHLAVDVELELVAGAVADPDRLRPLVAGQPGQLELGQPPLAGRAVHDLEVVRVAGDGSQQPAPPGLRLVLVAALEQGVEGEGRVAEPAVAVVPVADAAELLRQRRRRRGDDAAGRLVGQCLQDDQRLRHRLLPAAAVRAVVEPLAPERAGVAERLLRRRSPAALAMGRVPGEHERLSLPGLDGELGDGAEVLAAHRHGRAQRERVRPGDRDARLVVEAAHPGDDRAVVEPDHELDPHRHRSLEPSTIRTTSGSSPRGGMKSITRTLPRSQWKSSSCTSVRSR